MYGRNRPVAWRNRPEAWRTGDEPKHLHTIETSLFKSACPRCKIVDKCIAICLLMDQFIEFKEDFEFSMDYVLVWVNKARIFMKLWPKKTDFPDHARDFPNDVCDLPLCFLLIFNIALYSRFALYVAFSTFSVKFSLFALYSQSPCNPVFTVIFFTKTT